MLYVGDFSFKQTQADCDCALCGLALLNLSSTVSVNNAQDNVGLLCVKTAIFPLSFIVMRCRCSMLSLCSVVVMSVSAHLLQLQ